jgi:CPA1 family monovalent cation:H+ antiporter
MSDLQNWRTIELILEGAVFLVMGLELSAILGDLQDETRGIEVGWRIAAVALLAVLIVRALYVLPTLGLQRLSSRRGASMKPHLTAFQARLDDADPATAPELGLDETVAPGGRRGRERRRRTFSAESLRRFQTRLRRKVADIDYFMAVPLGWREGTVIVWAGMRGAVTLAAAQTLPQDTPDRSFIVFIAFLVAAGSLIIQGSTLPLIVRLVKPAGIDREAAKAEHAELIGMLRGVADDIVREHREAGRELPRTLRLEIIEAQREALLAARDDGTFSGSVLTGALETLDADQISMELRGEHRDEA